MNPTDPMTPVRALIEAAEGLKQELAEEGGPFSETYRDTAMAAVYCIPALTALLSEHDKVVALIADIRHDAELLGFTQGYRLRQVADKFAAIVEEK